MNLNPGGNQWVERWQKLSEGKFKLNTNVVICLDERCIGLGWVVSDSNGDFYVVKGMSWEGVFMPKETEALSIRKALSWVKGLRMDHHDVETDSNQVYFTLNS